MSDWRGLVHNHGIDPSCRETMTAAGLKGECMSADEADVSRLEKQLADVVNMPDHYTKLPVECIDVTEHFNFTLGNAIKYIWRADHKGKPLEDLRKARWYIDREIARRERDGQ